jgi:hypothetical protein
MSRLPIAAAVLPLALLAAANPFPASAAESYDNCAGVITSLPTTITTQGVWCLQGDLSTAIASGAAITVAANNVTIDCNDFKIGGLAAGMGTAADGIFVDGRQNAVVRRCNVRGFLRGIRTVDGGGHLIEGNRIVASTFIGIVVDSDGSLVRDNLVSDTGGSTLATVSGVGISVDGVVDILGNGIAAVEPGVGGGPVCGIAMIRGGGATIRDNRVSGLSPSFNEIGCGIYVSSSEAAIVEGNMLSGPRTADSTGILCESVFATAARNTIVGFDAGVAVCHSFSNAFNTN